MPVQPTKGRQVAIAVVLLAAVALIAVLGSLATIPNTEGWYQHVEKVAWNPPNSLFGPAWSILYLFIAVAGFLIWRAGYQGSDQPNGAKNVLALYVVQLILNGLWTPLFFAGYPLAGEIAWYVALVDITLLILVVAWLIPQAWKWSKTASMLLIPYLLWLLYASTLNLGIIVLN